MPHNDRILKAIFAYVNTIYPARFEVIDYGKSISPMNKGYSKDVPEYKLFLEEQELLNNLVAWNEHLCLVIHRDGSLGIERFCWNEHYTDEDINFQSAI